MEENIINTESNHPQLSSEYTFEAFVAGDSNNHPYTAAKEAASEPGTLHNPILIYGGEGSGKTHLMEAVGNYIHAQDKNKKICCITTDKFIHDLFSSIMQKKIMTFKEEYQSLDVLLLDDIQVLANKDTAQEELLNIFNALYERNCQMVFTCDRPLDEIKGIDDKLKERLTCGTSVELILPDYKTRLAIIEKKLSALNFYLPDEVKSLIAESVKTNVRNLENCVKMFSYFEALTGKAIDLTEATDLLKVLIL